ncbi:MAG: hypothetical protein ACI8PZ_002358 [Myxococcota bacterium]|jgi:hypothetical protein
MSPVLGLWLVAAHAGDLNFSPDRPGVGDSTGTVGAGHVMVEGGVTVLPVSPVSGGTSGIMGRFGVDDGLELRLRAPDIGIGGGVSVGSIGLGAKVAAAEGERWSVSAVPELFFDPTAAALGGGVNTNVALALDPMSFWVHSGLVVFQGVGAVLGGGAAVAFGDGGLYINGGHAVATTSFGGVGGWWAASPTVQLDAGVDMYATGADISPVVLVGTSIGF